MDEINKIGSVMIYEVTEADRRRISRLTTAAWLAPIFGAGIPIIASIIIFLLFAATPPLALTILAIGLIFTFIGSALGVGSSIFFANRRNSLKKELREKIAADGIRANEVEWFRNELKTAEKKALADIKQRDLLLGDAYLETLASRLTATRIVRSSKRELNEMQRRRSKLRHLNKTGNSDQNDFLEVIEKDIERLAMVNDEAKRMLVESETRLQMIEAASVRVANLADSEFALGRLSERTKQLPLALENAIQTEKMRIEMQSVTGENESEK